MRMKNVVEKTLQFELPKLPYSYGALEPYIDAETMETHYLKHHGTYVNKLNEALGKYPELPDMSIEDILLSINSIPEDIRNSVRNHGGGHANHSLFWRIMKKKGGGLPGGDLGSEIGRMFGSFERFREDFSKTAANIFGSGWAWLVLDTEGMMRITATANQDSPYMAGMTPIMGLDVWEHAYYLKYRNRRADYIESWWNVLNWNEIERNFDAARD
jgi:Fe-Mn family superoxide dismutase